MANVYYEPEKFGLEKIEELERGGHYEFDTVVVWRKLENGQLVWANDSGCSCPTPFEGMGISDLKPLPETVAEFTKEADDIEFVHKIEALIK